MVTKFESYEINANATKNIFAGNWVTQTFTPLIEHTITSVFLLLMRQGAPGLITVTIRETDGADKPTAVILCTGTTAGGTLPVNPSEEWREITLGAGSLLSVGIQYAIVVSLPSGDGANRINWRSDVTDPEYTRGLEGESGDSGSIWLMKATVDMMFQEWGEAAGGFPQGGSMGIKLMSRGFL